VREIPSEVVRAVEMSRFRIWFHQRAQRSVSRDLDGPPLPSSQNRHMGTLVMSANVNSQAIAANRLSVARKMALLTFGLLAGAALLMSVGG
jgi:hypothetical protein